MRIKHLFCVLSVSCLIICAHAKNNDPDGYAFMTARDVKENTFSNITLINRTANPITVYGLFIPSYDANDCSACFGNILGGDNMDGAAVSPVTFKVNQAVPIGQNYLYNMLYNGIYFIRTNGATPCQLPGCSWPGDTPNLKWCITINAVSLDSNYTNSAYTNGSHPPAQVPAYSAAATSGGLNYKYALINPATLGTGNACLGPITCDDKTLTCRVNRPQSESFQPYA